MQRRWFQLHLSTALIAMLTAGVVLGMNLSAVPDRTNTVAYGWSARVLLQFTDADARIVYEEGALINILFVLAIVSAVAFLIEYVIRRRSDSREQVR